MNFYRASERRCLQITMAVAGLVPVGAGLAGVVRGPELLRLPNDPSAWSHVRYLSGLLLAIGLVLWVSIPGIERHRKRLEWLFLVVFIGGLARITGYVALGDAPGRTMLFALGMELIVTPGLWVWQRRISEGEV